MTTADAKARARKRLEGWLADTPRYLGDDPRAVHYRANVEALELAITALEASPNSRTEAMEIAVAFDDAAIARDEAGFLGTPADCIRHLNAELQDALAMQAARPIDQQEVTPGIDRALHAALRDSTEYVGPIAPVQDDER